MTLRDIRKVNEAKSASHPLHLLPSMSQYYKYHSSSNTNTSPALSKLLDLLKSAVLDD
jgi:hypothetical protein